MFSFCRRHLYTKQNRRRHKRKKTLRAKFAIGKIRSDCSYIINIYTYSHYKTVKYEDPLLKSMKPWNQEYQDDTTITSIVANTNSHCEENA